MVIANAMPILEHEIGHMKAASGSLLGSWMFSFNYWHQESDDVITLLERYDLLLVSRVRQGNVNYNVIYDTSGMSPDRMQRLTYKCVIFISTGQERWQFQRHVSTRTSWRTSLASLSTTRLRLTWVMSFGFCKGLARIWLLEYSLVSTSLLVTL